jgi:DNA replication protein DnaC
MIESRNDNELSHYIKQFKKIDLLIIDELGYIAFDLAADELLFQLLATRYETMSTIITSNLGFSDWVKVFHDRTLTEHERKELPQKVKRRELYTL